MARKDAARDGEVTEDEREAMSPLNTMDTGDTDIEDERDQEDDDE